MAEKNDTNRKHFCYLRDDIRLYFLYHNSAAGYYRVCSCVNVHLYKSLFSLILFETKKLFCIVMINSFHLFHFSEKSSI